MPEVASVQPPPNPSEQTDTNKTLSRPPSPRNHKALLGATFLIIFIESVVIAFLGYQNYQLRHQSVLPPESPETPSSAFVSSTSPSPSPSLECLKEGETFFPNDGNKCCEGLKEKWNYEKQEDGSCIPISKPLVDDEGNPQIGGHQKICVRCGDGICDKGENGCFCPQDCHDVKCKEHGEIPIYTGPDDDMGIQCCNNLTHGTQKEYFDDHCQLEPVGGYIGICLACGDGACDSEFESPCNCPEDCQ